MSAMYRARSSNTDRVVISPSDPEGSPRGHKGLSVLRAAVGQLAGDGFRLGVTSNAPEDAKPWEEWYGQTSLRDGLALV